MAIYTISDIHTLLLNSSQPAVERAAEESVDEKALVTRKQVVSAVFSSIINPVELIRTIKRPIKAIRFSFIGSTSISEWRFRLVSGLLHAIAIPFIKVALLASALFYPKAIPFFHKKLLVSYSTYKVMLLPSIFSIYKDQNKRRRDVIQNSIKKAMINSSGSASLSKICKWERVQNLLRLSGDDIMCWGSFIKATEESKENKQTVQETEKPEENKQTVHDNTIIELVEEVRAQENQSNINIVKAIADMDQEEILLVKDIAKYFGYNHVKKEFRHIETIISMLRHDDQLENGWAEKDLLNLTMMFKSSTQIVSNPGKMIQISELYVRKLEQDWEKVHGPRVVASREEQEE